ncbi:MAG: carboxypeptidase-like regulatory domain-containing protein [Bacteroidota bacterium]
MSTSAERYLLVIIMLWAVSISFGQIKERISISGRIIDHQTNNPIPYVNIGVLDSYVGTSSDDQGKFQLSIPNKLRNSQIIFSSIGYKTKPVLISEINSSDKLVIKLLEDTLNLQSLTFRESEDPKEILRQAFAKEDPSSYLIQQYYQGKVDDLSGKVYYDVEAILHNERKIIDGNIGVSNCATQKKNNLTEGIDNHYFQYFMFYFNVTDDSYHCDLSADKCLSGLDITMDKYIPYDGKLVYKIDYSFQDTRKLSLDRKGIKSLAGTAYIEPENLDLIRWVIQGEFEEVSRSKILKAGGKGYPIDFTWIRNYREVDSKYYLSLLDVIQRNQQIPVSGAPTTITQKHSCFSMDVKFGDQIERNTNCESYDLNNIPYDETFWQGFKNGVN